MPSMVRKHPERCSTKRIHEASSEEEVVRGRLLVLVEYLRSIQRNDSR